MTFRRRLAVAGLVAAMCTRPAAAQTSFDVELLSHQDLYTEYASLWGWTGGGKELVILGTLTGTSIVDVTDPGAPDEIAFIPGVSSSWREMKTYSHYAYIVTEGAGGGMQIVDLATNPPSLVATYTATFTTAHTITIRDGYAYVNGARNLGSPVGIRILNLTDPVAPVDDGGWNGFYTHDCQVRGNTLYAACISDSRLAIVDVTNRSAPSLIHDFTWVGNAAHNCDLTDDGRYLLTTDETGGGRLHIFDVQNPSNPVLVTEWTANPGAIIHNVHILGNLAYIAYYTEGTRILDITDPTLPIEVGWYDTWPGASGGFFGNWAVYPYAASGNAYLSDISSGLYVVRFTPSRGSVSGTVREVGLGTILAGAQVQTTAGAAGATNVAGRFRLFDAPGATTLVTSCFGFAADSAAVSITLGQDTPHDVDLVRLPGTALGGTVRALAGGTPLPGASIALETSPLVETSDGGGLYGFDQVPYGVWAFTASRFGYTPLRRTVVLSQFEAAPAIDFDLSPALLTHDFEPSATWAAGGGTASSGQWVWSDPVGSGGGTVQPENDHSSAPGVRCWVTGNAASPASAIGTADVDNGTTILLSPVFDLTGLAHPELSYWRWFSNDAGANPGTDTLRVDLSNNGGMTWKSIEKVVQSTPAWTQVTVAIENLVTPTATMRVRVIAEDLGMGSVVEAGIDDFTAYGFATTSAPPTAAARTRLHANVPNPFNASTRVRFELATPGRAQVDLFDVRGRWVRTLLDEPFGAGVQERVWDGRDAGGRTVASGTYVLRLRSGDVVVTRRLQLVK